MIQKTSCDCPLCGQRGAEIKSDKNARLYLVCDYCVCMIRTSSRMGQDKLRALARAGAVHTPPAPDPVGTPPPEPPPPTPAPTPAPKAKPAPKTTKPNDLPWYMK